MPDLSQKLAAADRAALDAVRREAEQALAYNVNNPFVLGAALRSLLASTADLVDDIVAKGRETAPSREEARLRLTCAALTGCIAGEGSNLPGINAEHAVANADACLALLYPEVPK